jgi:hypothetical protein
MVFWRGMVSFSEDGALYFSALGKQLREGDASGLLDRLDLLNVPREEVALLSLDAPGKDGLSEVYVFYRPWDPAKARVYELGASDVKRALSTGTLELPPFPMHLDSRQVVAYYHEYLRDELSETIRSVGNCGIALVEEKVFSLLV